MESMESVKVVLDSGVGKLEKFFWDNKDAIVENMYISATPFLMLLFARRSHKAYIKFEIFATIMHALIAIFCPKTIYRHLMNVQLDLYHYNLCTIISSVAVASVLYPMFLMNSKDESVLAGYSHSRMIANAMGFLVSIHTYKFDSEWNYRVLCTYGAVNLVGFLVNGYYYFTTCKGRTHSTFNDTINYFAKLESIKGFIYGLMFFSLPQLVLLSTAGKSHVIFARIIGMFMVQMALQAHGVSDFMYLADKKTFILSRLIGGFLTMQALVVGYVYYSSSIVSVERLAMILGGFLVYSAVLGYGYTTAKVKKD